MAKRKTKKYPTGGPTGGIGSQIKDAKDFVDKYVQSPTFNNIWQQNIDPFKSYLGGVSFNIGSSNQAGDGSLINLRRGPNLGERTTHELGHRLVRYLPKTSAQRILDLANFSQTKGTKLEEEIKGIFASTDPITATNAINTKAAAIKSLIDSGQTKGLTKDEKKFGLLHQVLPTEVSSDLLGLKYKLFTKNVVDPINSSVPVEYKKEHLDSIKNDSDTYRKLKKNFSDDAIIEMLNSVVDVDSSLSAPTIAKYGGAINNDTPIGRYGGYLDNNTMNINRYPLGGITGINPGEQDVLSQILGGLGGLGGGTGPLGGPGGGVFGGFDLNQGPVAPDLASGSSGQIGGTSPIGGAQVGGIGAAIPTGGVVNAGNIDVSSLAAALGKVFNNDRNNANRGNVDPLRDIQAFQQNPYQGFLARNGLLAGGAPPLGFVNADPSASGVTTLPSTYLLGNPNAFQHDIFAYGGIPHAGLGGFFKKIGKGIGKVAKGVGDFGLSLIGAPDIIDNTIFDKSKFLGGLTNVLGTLGRTALNVVAPGLGTGIGVLGQGLNSLGVDQAGNPVAGGSGTPGAGANHTNILNTMGVPAELQVSGLFDPTVTTGGTFGQEMFGQVPNLTFQNPGTVTTGKWGGKIKKSKKKYADGGIVSLIPEGLIGIQTEKVGNLPERLVHPDGSITKVNATKKHERMDDDEITDVVMEGTYVVSAQPRMKISKGEAKEYFLGYKDMPYEELKKGKIPQETTFADLFPKSKSDSYKMTPTEIAEKIRSKFEVVDYNDMDVFTQKTNQENLQSRVPYLSSLIEISEQKRPKPTAKQLVKDQIREENDAEDFPYGGSANIPSQIASGSTSGMPITFAPIQEQKLMKIDDLLLDNFGSRKKAQQYVKKQNKKISAYNKFINDNGIEGQVVDANTIPNLDDLEWFSPSEFSKLTGDQIEMSRRVRTLDSIKSSDGSQTTSMFQKMYGGYKYGGKVEIPKAPFGGDFLNALGGLFTGGNLGNTLGMVGSVLGQAGGITPGVLPGPNAFGADLPVTAIDPASAALMNQAYQLNTTGNIQNIQGQQGALQNALGNLGGLTSDLQNLNDQGTAVGLAGILGQQTDLPNLQLDTSRLRGFNTRTPNSFIQQAATPTIDVNSAIDRLGTRAGGALASNVNAQGIQGRNNAAMNAFNQQQNLDLGLAQAITGITNDQAIRNQVIDSQEVDARNNQLSGAAGQIQGNLSNRGNILSNAFSTGTGLDMQLAGLSGQIPRAIAQDALNMASTNQSLFQQQNALDILRAQLMQQAQTQSGSEPGSIDPSTGPGSIYPSTGPGSIDPSIGGALPAGTIGINPDAPGSNPIPGAGGIGLGAGFGSNPLGDFGNLFGTQYTGIPQIPGLGPTPVPVLPGGSGCVNGFRTEIIGGQSYQIPC